MFGGEWYVMCGFGFFGFLGSGWSGRGRCCFNTVGFVWGGEGMLLGISAVWVLLEQVWVECL